MLKIIFSSAFLRSIIEFYFFWKIIFFIIYIIIESLSLKKENIIKDIRNFFRLKKEINYTVVT